MFNRYDFDSIISTAESHAQRADQDPTASRDALLSIITALKLLGDSCENDLNEQLRAARAEFDTGIER